MTRAQLMKKLEKAPPADYHDLSTKLRGYLRVRNIKILDWKTATKLASKEKPDAPLPIGCYFHKEKAIWAHNNLYSDVYFKVLLHETAHYVLGHTGADNDYDRYRIELEAEATAGIVCERLKIFDLSQTGEYLQRKGLSHLGIPLQSFKAIRNAANLIMKECFGIQDSELIK